MLLFGMFGREFGKETVMVGRWIGVKVRKREEVLVHGELKCKKVEGG
jgi:hypothetical protein